MDRTNIQIAYTNNHYTIRQQDTADDIARKGIEGVLHYIMSQKGEMNVILDDSINSERQSVIKKVTEMKNKLEAIGQLTKYPY